MKHSFRNILLALAILGVALITTPTWGQWLQSAQLTPSPAQSELSFGTAMAISGNTMVVGAPELYYQAPNAAYVFTESNGVWTQVAKVTPSDLSNGFEFGLTVAVSENTVVVGSIPPCCLDVSGAVYVFQKPSTGWTDMTETAKLTDGSVTQDGFGDSVAVSGDTIAAGAFAQVGTNNGQGAVYIFVKPALGWASTTPTAQLTASDGKANDELGGTVALQGGTVVAGAAQATAAGAAYVFLRPSTGWVSEHETAKLTSSDGASEDMFGGSIGISADESTIVIGAPGRQFRTNVPNGGAYIFTKPVTVWQTGTQTAELLPPPPSQEFGWSVSINGPGTIVAVGAPNTFVGSLFFVGAAYVYRKPTAGWPSTPAANARLNPPSPQQLGLFGRSVGVRATTVDVGEPNATVNGILSGAVYVFDRP